MTEDNHKKGIVGTFSRFFSQRFPVSFPPWGIYAAVTNLEPGEHQFAINLVSETTNQVVVPLSGKFPTRAPSDVVELTMMIQGAVFPHPGLYNLTFSVGGDPVGSRALMVEKVPESGG